jgi:hypothetical protein
MTELPSDFWEMTGLPGKIKLFLPLQQPIMSFAQGLASIGKSDNYLKLDFYFRFVRQRCP